MTTLTLILPGTIRSKKNSREPRKGKTKTGKIYKFNGKSDAYIAWEARAQQAARSMLNEMHIKPMAHDFKLTIKAFMKGNLMDLDAVHTSVMDCLQGIVWVNDKQVKRFSGDSFVEREAKFPRTEVTVEKL